MPEIICATTLGCLILANRRDTNAASVTTMMIWISS